MEIEENASHAIVIHSLQKIIDYIEENIVEPLTPASIAKRFYLSVSSVHMLFRVGCDLALMEYIRNRRLTLAGQELLESDIRIIDLAYKYGYETPEAFARAFSRFHGFPPSLVRRVYPALKVFSPIQIKVEISGGWEDMTNMKSQRQEIFRAGGYTDLTKLKGEIRMHHIATKHMTNQEDWKVLLALADKLEAEGIPFKADGKTIVFAHGFDFKLEKICLTFLWNDKQRLLDLFSHQEEASGSSQPGFWYFDTLFGGMKVRCMSYGDERPESNTKDSLYRNTDLVNADGHILPVQTVEFYLANAESKDNEFYQTVSRWAEARE